MELALVVALVGQIEGRDQSMLGIDCRLGIVGNLMAVAGGASDTAGSTATYRFWSEGEEKSCSDMRS